MKWMKECCRWECGLLPILPWIIYRRSNASKTHKDTFILFQKRGIFMRNLKQKHERPPVHSYGAKTLPFRMPLNGISDRTLQNHHDKLYVAYVEKKNEIENQDRKSTRLNSSHLVISYAVFCLKKKKRESTNTL